ncbi:hypothetical protein GCM10025767_30450 [Thalassotalea piscium]
MGVNIVNLINKVATSAIVNISHSCLAKYKKGGTNINNFNKFNMSFSGTVSFCSALIRISCLSLGR